MPAPAEPVIRLIVADDHPVTREGLAMLLHHQADMTVVAQARDGVEAVDLYAEHRPDVAVLDVQMPRCSGVEATSRIVGQWPDARVVLLTTYDGEEDVFRGLSAGAKAYLLKETPTEQLLTAIRAVSGGGQYLSSEASVALAKRRGAPSLTARELGVLRLVARGLANKQIAAELSIGEGTIKSHLNSLMSKLNVASRTEAVMEATARGMLPRMTEPTPTFSEPAARRAIELVEAHEALTRSVARLSCHADLPGILTTVLQEIVRASGAVSVAVFAYDAGRDELYNYAQLLRGETIDVKTDPRVAVFADPTRATGNPAWEAMVQQRYFWVDFNSPDARAGPNSTAWHRANRHGYVVCIPMMNGPQPVGFLGLAFDRSEVVRPTELRLERSRVLAQQAALAMQLTRLSEEASASIRAEERRRADSAKHAALLEERNRMAREIHDTLAQSFTGVMMQLRAAQSAIGARAGANLTPVEDCLARAEALAREGLRDARRSVMALRPEAAEFADPVAKARWLIEQSTGGTPVRGRVEVEGDPRPVPADVGFHLFRIAQEAVANALRHAGATSLAVRLSFTPDTLTLDVIDDGHGFAPAADDGAGSGLIGMRHRAGQINAELSIDTAPNGTTVRVVAPFGGGGSA